MRGLPPPPPNVFRWTLFFDVDSAFASIGFWVLAPGAELASEADVVAFAGDLLLEALPFTSGLTHTGCSVVRSRLLLAVPVKKLVDTIAAPNSGHWTGGQVNTAATGLHFWTADRGSGRQTVIHMPGLPDIATTDHVRVTQGWWELAREAAVTFVDGVNALAPFGGQPVQLGCVHRQLDGAPLDVATFTAFEAVIPTGKVATIRRRIPPHRQLSPSQT